MQLVFTWLAERERERDTEDFPARVSNGGAGRECGVQGCRRKAVPGCLGPPGSLRLPRVLMSDHLLPLTEHREALSQHSDEQVSPRRGGTGLTTRYRQTLNLHRYLTLQLSKTRGKEQHTVTC